MKNDGRKTKDVLAVCALGAILALACPLLMSLATQISPPTLGAFVARATFTPLPTAAPTATGLPTRAPSVTRTPTRAATVLPRVYLLPLRRVFALGQAQPQSDAPFLLYLAGSDEFQVIAQQGAYVRLQTLDARINFWTPRENVSTIPPAPAEYDDRVRDKTARLAPNGFACLQTEMPAPVFSICQALPAAASARVLTKIVAGHVTFYLVEINGKPYFVPPEVIVAIP